MNSVAGMIVDLRLSVLFVFVVPLQLLLLQLILVVEHETLFSSVYLASDAVKIWLNPYLVWLCFPQKWLFYLSLLYETQTLHYIYLCSSFWSMNAGRYKPWHQTFPLEDTVAVSYSSLTAIPCRYFGLTCLENFRLHSPLPAMLMFS